MNWAVRATLIAFILAGVATTVIGPPVAYPIGTIVTVSKGETVIDVANTLAASKAVEWPRVFALLVRLQGRPIVAGTYLLPRSENAVSLAFRFSHHKTEVQPVKVTIPEGTSVREEAGILTAKLNGFDGKSFIKLASSSEGYLFPDTYFFMPGESPDNAARLMRQTFDLRIAPIDKNIEAFGITRSNAVIMASILEKEARLPQTRRLVAGILWKRLALGMPLQVDATFGYILGKDTYSPTASDLTVDSPYNTYKYKGLPPGPIDNPGIEAIEDAVTPIASAYLYYVTDADGNIYYAKTYDEHLKNVQKARAADLRSSKAH